MGNCTWCAGWEGPLSSSAATRYGSMSMLSPCCARPSLSQSYGQRKQALLILFCFVFFIYCSFWTCWLVQVQACQVPSPRYTQEERKIQRTHSFKSQGPSPVHFHFSSQILSWVCVELFPGYLVVFRGEEGEKIESNVLFLKNHYKNHYLFKG